MKKYWKQKKSVDINRVCQHFLFRDDKYNFKISFFMLAMLLLAYKLYTSDCDTIYLFGKAIFITNEWMRYTQFFIRYRDAVIFCCQCVFFNTFWFIFFQLLFWLVAVVVAYLSLITLIFIRKYLQTKCYGASFMHSIKSLTKSECKLCLA